MDRTRTTSLIAHAAAVVLVVGVLSLPEDKAAAPSCIPAGAPICEKLRDPEFGGAYDEAYARRDDPEDAVRDLRRTIRDAIVGYGHAGPAAIGRRLDIALDEALATMKRRLCGVSKAETLAPAAVADVLATTANRSFGAALDASSLGAMTGSLLGAAQASSRGVQCLCTAEVFEGIGTSCASSGSP